MVFKRLKELRINKGISQEELAKYLCIARSNIGKYENGDLDLNTEILIKYAQFFNVSIDYILGNSDAKGKEVKSPDGDIKEQLIYEIKDMANKMDIIEIKALISILNADYSIVDLKNTLANIQKFSQSKKKQIC